MKSRILPILNATGCVILAGVLVAQWSKERRLDDTNKTLSTSLQAAQKQAAAEAERAAGLDRDVAALKESIEATQKAADASELALAEKETQIKAFQTDVTTAAGEQVKVWEAAIAERDEKLKSLNSDLTATRTRLNEAIAKLKEAGAR